MKRLHIKYHDAIEYPEDVKRIGDILYRKKYWSTPDECQEIWRLYSDSLCAGWLGLPEHDDEVFQAVSPWIEN